MVDGTLTIANCGTSSILNNSIINSLIETQRLTLSDVKSVVLHVGKNCKKLCPKIKVHEKELKVVYSVRYLGDIISASGALWPSVEDKRCKGLGKLAEVTGILSKKRDK